MTIYSSSFNSVVNVKLPEPWLHRQNTNSLAWTVNIIYKEWFIGQKVQYVHYILFWTPLVLKSVEKKWSAIIRSDVVKLC